MSNPTTSLAPLELAQHYTEQGWPVFPCRSQSEEHVDQHGEITTLGEKTPLTTNGFKAATRFARILDRWWTDWPDAAVGLPTGSPTGFFALDIDNKPGGSNGFIWLDEMQAEHGPLPSTARVISPNGGMHIYFKYVVGTRNRGALGAGVDIRSEGGYVVAAGSTMSNGRQYKWVDDVREIADAPAWLLDLLLPKSAPTHSSYTASSATNNAYVDAAVDRELADLAGAPMGNRNNSLNDAAFALGTFVGAGALQEAEARALLQDVARGWGRDWSRCCKTIENGLKAGIAQPRHIPEPDFQPQDNTTLRDVTRMIQRGLEKARTKAAANDNESISEMVSLGGDAADEGGIIPNEGEVAPHGDNVATVSAGAFHATAFKWIDPSTLPRREFAFGTHYIRKYVSVTVSPGGLGKTSNSIVEALSMVSGLPLAGVKPSERLNVWLFNAEDPRDEMDRRIMAACVHYGLKPEDIEGRLFLDTGREQELIVMHEDKKTGLQVNEPVVEAVVEQIERHSIDVMIVDPFVSTHRVNENDNGAIDKVAKLWAQIADYTNCAVDVVHHLKKLADREATVEDARGAVSLIGAARSVRVLNRMSGEQAIRAGLSDSERFSYFYIHHGKVNLTKMDNSEHWRKLESVGLGNGGKGNLAMLKQDTAGVVTEWKWPSTEDIAELVPQDVRAEVVVKLANMSCRESPQSEDWAGYVLAAAMGMEVETNKVLTPEKRKVKAVLDAWISNGILQVVNEPDPKHIGRKIKFVRPVEEAA